MARGRQALMRAWEGQNDWQAQVLSLAMRPLSWVFGALVSARRWLYHFGYFKQQTLPVPVIVVGNVMVGGVGKTPITIALVQHLTAQGWSVGVLSRGYGRKTSSDTHSIQAVHHSSAAAEVGDEPLLIARLCQVPVFVSSDRAAAGRALLAAHPNVQVLVCDDGLQHWALARDLELCVFDERGVGNGRLLPAGPLRESWPRPISRSKWFTPASACWVINTGGDSADQAFAVQRRLADFAQQANGTQRALQSWANTTVQALAGIAKPEVFFAMLRDKGVTLSHTHAMPDHADLQDLPDDLFKGDVLCTEKDAVKLWPIHPNAWAVPLITTLAPELLEAVDQFLARSDPTKLSSTHGQQTT
jgi:tetraacyldisaccharide 4'-kinase